MNKPKVSIIVPVYNVEKFLPKCLDSLVNQTMRDIEIICVNDGSTDESPSICDQYASNDSRIKIIHKENAGLSKARNTGLCYVTGDYFMFVDSDDWLTADCCAEMYHAAIMNEADCVACTYAKEYENRYIVVHSYPSSFNCRGIVLQSLRRRVFGPIGDELARPQDLDITVCAWAHLFSSKIYKQILFEDNRKLGTFEDGLYLIDILKRCKCFSYIDKPFYRYRKTNEGSIVTAYKKSLYQKWEYLYKQIEYRIYKEGLGVIYQEALSNRIACGVLSLGLNEVSSNETFTEQAKRLDEILALPRYQKAIQNLEIKSMGIPWKVFFLLCKHKKTKLMVIMLRVIDFIRKHH